MLCYKENTPSYVGRMYYVLLRETHQSSAGRMYYVLLRKKHAIICGQNVLCSLKKKKTSICGQNVLFIWCTAQLTFNTPKLLVNRQRILDRRRKYGHRSGGWSKRLSSGTSAVSEDRIHLHTMSASQVGGEAPEVITELAMTGRAFEALVQNGLIRKYVYVVFVSYREDPLNYLLFLRLSYVLSVYILL